MARRFASGESIYSIVNDFNKRQIPLPRGGKRWHHNSVRKIVTNAAYIGKRTHCGQVVADAMWPAILGEETFYACVQIYTDPKRRTTATARSSI